MKYACDGPEEYFGFNGVDLSRTDCSSIVRL